MPFNPQHLKLLNNALVKREALKKITNAMRLVNGQGDGLEGLLIDRYGTHINVQILNDKWSESIGQIQGVLNEHFSLQYLIVKYRREMDIKTQVLLKGDSKTMVEEYGLKFEVDLNDGLNAGLFLDMRANRQRLGQLCKGKRVLNCFSYTCSFGVHARANGALKVVNVDISRKILDKARRNYDINQIPTEQYEFVKNDSMEFLTRAVKKDNRFDCIVLDPPSFARHDGKVFQVKRDLPKLIGLATVVLNPSGILFVSSNCSELTYEDLERMLRGNLNSRQVKEIKRVGQDVDFIGSNSFKESYLVGLQVSLI